MILEYLPYRAVEHILPTLMSVWSWSPEPNLPRRLRLSRHGRDASGCCAAPVLYQGS